MKCNNFIRFCLLMKLKFLETSVEFVLSAHMLFNSTVFIRFADDVIPFTNKYQPSTVAHIWTDNGSVLALDLHHAIGYNSVIRYNLGIETEAILHALIQFVFCRRHFKRRSSVPLHLMSPSIIRIFSLQPPHNDGIVSYIFIIMRNRKIGNVFLIGRLRKMKEYAKIPYIVF